MWTPEFQQEINHLQKNYHQKIEEFLQWWLATRLDNNLEMMKNQCEFLIPRHHEDLPESRQKDLIKEFVMSLKIGGQEDMILERRFFCWKEIK